MTRSTAGYQAVARYDDRTDAGQRLADRLALRTNSDALVLAIPRGGVPVAAVVAERLGAELDVVVARKLGAPGAPEFAIGAVTANGGLYLSTRNSEGVAPSYVNRVVAAERAEAQRREARFRAGRPPPRIAGRTVIVVDDGLATGATMRAALRSVRQAKPAWLVAAVPVGPHDTCVALGLEADEIICLQEPEPFYAVGLHYVHFEPTEDEEVQRLLDQAAARPAQPRGR